MKLRTPVTLFLFIASIAMTANSSILFERGDILSTGLRSTDMALGDINGDGHEDLVFTNMTESTYGIAFNNGEGAFGAVTTWQLPDGRLNPLALDCGDIDGDGITDIVIAYNQTIDNSPQPFRDSAILVLWGNGDATFEALELGMFGVPSSVLIEDINADDQPDLVIGNNGGLLFDLGFIDQVDPGIVVWTNQGNRSFSAADEIVTEGAVIEVKAADINNDGLVDIVGSNQGIPEITLSPIGLVLARTKISLFANSDAGLSNTGSVSLELPPWGFDFADLNGDEFIDLAVAILGKSDSLNVLEFLGTQTAVKLYRNTGFGFTSFADVNTPGVTFSPIMRDFDLDGDVDLAVTVQEIQGNLLVPSLRIYEQVEEGVFVEVGSLAVEEEPRYMLTDDFDDDGDEDLAVLCIIVDGADPTDTAIGRIYVYLNQAATNVGQWALY
ncbi:MAG: VCBS repeat-containing protein [Candidatus Hinthialibacter antarcticus]|nr:VCBS repeat-containing protein [Candidatus Hinthialibacter antarcticus]